MKTMFKFLAVAVLSAFTLTSCKKECPTPNPATSLEVKLQGHYEQVGFKNQLFNEWSYTSSGPEFDIIGDSITGIYSTSFQEIGKEHILLESTNELVKVTFGDTIVFAFQNGDSTKLIKY